MEDIEHDRRGADARMQRGLYLGRGEQKTITVTATSAGLGPSLLLYG